MVVLATITVVMTPKQAILTIVKILVKIFVKTATKLYVSPVTVLAIANFNIVIS